MSSHSDRERDKAKESRGAGDAAARESSEAAAEDSQRSAGAASESEQVRKLLAEKQELLDTLVRRQADFENYRKRVERERHSERHRGVESLVENLLPVLDAFERALAASDDSAGAEYRKGFDLIRRQLWDALAKQGLTRVESLGKEFNPHFHHAIERVQTSEYADGTVVGELQPGYLFHDRVLRPAMVRVTTAPEAQSAHASKRDN